VTEQILACHKMLTPSPSKERYRVRAILVREVSSEAFAVVVTNIDRREEPDAGKIVDKYKARWGRQENFFKQMKPSLYLDTNPGTNGIAQREGRGIPRRVTDLGTKIQARQRKIKSTLNKIRKAEEMLNQLDESIKVDGTSLKPPEQSEKRVLRREEIRASLSSHGRALNTPWLNLDALNKRLEGIARAEVLYEIDPRKDQIMTNFETALNNADLFVKEHYLPAQYRRSDFRTRSELLSRQQGKFLEPEAEIRVPLNHDDQAPEHQMLAEFAAKKIGDAQLLLNTGKRLIIQVAES